MTPLADWCVQWGVSGDALADLQRRVLNLDPGPAPVGQPATSEAGVQAAVRVAASRRGWRLWRNNLGVFSDPERNIHVRYGLANDSAQVNAVLKSADLIGIRPLIVQPSDVGRLIGQFVSREVKHAGWKYRGDAHEQAQVNWATLVNTLGGDASFTSSAEDF